MCEAEDQASKKSFVLNKLYNFRDVYSGFFAKVLSHPILARLNKRPGDTFRMPPNVRKGSLYGIGVLLNISKVTPDCKSNEAVQKGSSEFLKIPLYTKPLTRVRVSDNKEFGFQITNNKQQTGVNQCPT